MKDQAMTRREFLKRNIFLAATIALLGLPLKAMGQAFSRKEKDPNVSGKEARYYSKLAG